MATNSTGITRSMKTPHHWTYLLEHKLSPIAGLLCSIIALTVCVEGIHAQPAGAGTSQLMMAGRGLDIQSSFQRAATEERGRNLKLLL